MVIVSDFGAEWRAQPLSEPRLEIEPLSLCSGAKHHLSVPSRTEAPEIAMFEKLNPVPMGYLVPMRCTHVAVSWCLRPGLSRLAGRIGFCRSRPAKLLINAEEACRKDETLFCFLSL